MSSGHNVTQTQCAETQHNRDNSLKLQPATFGENSKNIKAQRSPYPSSREGYLTEEVLL